jgi:acyl-CoA synthetase (NDP forming)
LDRRRRSGPVTGPIVNNRGEMVSTERRPIERLLRPRSVVVVGASSTPGALGASVIDNLDRLKFTGAIHLVNPKRENIGTRRCLNSVAELPLGVDVAVLAIPKAAVLESLRALIERQIGAAVIFSAGFAEGGAVGLAEQREIARLAREHRVMVEGPNCLGLVNYVDGVALTFVETPASKLKDHKGVGIISQSGAMACVLGVTLASRDIGLSYSISTGNEAASGVEDYLEYLLDDPNTSVIALIVEQFRTPRRFLDLAQRAADRGKRIVVLHPGRSGAARESAATHTGAMAGDYQVMRARVSHRGVIVIENLQEFGDVIELAYRMGFPRESGTAVLTESGAFKALTLDLCEEVGLELPALTDASAPALRQAIPDFVPVSNPVDLTAQGLVDPGIYRRALAALMSDERFGIIVLGIIQTDEKTAAAKFPTILEALRELPRTQSVVFAGLDEGAVIPRAYIKELRALGVPYFPAPDRAFRALAQITRIAMRTPEPIAPLHLLERPAPGVIPEYLAKRLLAPLGFTFPCGQLVRSLDEAREAAQQLGYPVALKAQAAALPHKSDAGGVVLNLKAPEQLAAGWARLQQDIARNRPGLVLDGVLIEAMGESGVELIVGGRHDLEWGPVVLVGFGGVQAELLKDFALLSAETSREQLIAALYSLKGGALFRGFRGQPALDIEAVANLVATLGALLIGEPSIAEVDLNPVIVYPRGRGVMALDALLQVS